MRTLVLEPMTKVFDKNMYKAYSLKENHGITAQLNPSNIVPISNSIHSIRTRYLDLKNLAICVFQSSCSLA